jgi:periplasmic protein TonB
MITSYPLSTLPPAPLRPAAPAVGAWHYPCARRSRAALIFAAAFSAALHGAIFFGIPRPPRKVVVLTRDHYIPVSLEIPQVKELEEPEPLVSDEPLPPTESFSAVPMQADLPQMPQPTDFVQQIDFSSLVEKPDLSQAKLLSIPDTIRRGGKVGTGIPIFDLKDLDRVPEPIVQPAPLYPHAMRREAETATVVVEFIVETTGGVSGAFAYSTTHRGFNDAAVHGVERWKFRPGIRAGRKVNTRMRVPITFTLLDPSS